MTKIVGTLGPKSRPVEVISGCLKAGMCGINPFFFLFPLFYPEKMEENWENTTLGFLFPVLLLLLLLLLSPWLLFFFLSVASLF